MSDTYGISAVVDADDSGFQSTFDRVEGSLAQWGLDFDKLYAKGSEFFKGFGVDIDKFAGKLGTTGPKLAAGVGIAVAAMSALKAVIADTTAEWAEDETALLRFNAAIAANSSMTSGAADRLNELADSFGMLTGNSTAAIQNMITMLSATGRTEKQINDMMIAAQGLATATGVDLNTALTQLNMTFSGSTGKLAKATPALAELTEEELKNGAAVDLLKEKYGQFADVLGQSSAVSIQNYENTIGEIKSALGEFFESGIKPIRDKITEFMRYLVSHKEVLIGIIEGIGFALAVVIGLFNPILGGIALIVTAFFTLQHAVGGWKILWLEVQRIALVVVKAVLDYISWLATGMVEQINSILSIYNTIADKLGGKPIRLLDKVDISAAVGLNKALADVEAQIASTRAENDKLKGASVEATKAASAATVESIQTAMDWRNKEREARLASLEKMKAADIEYAKASELTARDILEIAVKYDDEALALYKEKIDAERALSIAEAREKKADAETIARISKYYDDMVTEYTSDQISTRSAMYSANVAVAKAAEEEKTRQAKAEADKQTDFWKEMYKDLTEGVKDWASAAISVASDIAKTLEGTVGDAMRALGESIYNGTSAWDALANAALKGLADVLSAIAKQLIALAVVYAVSLRWGAAAIAVAGAAAAYIASGVVSAWADKYAATGDDYTQAGTYIVGERGPEMITLPQGASVMNAQDTKSARGGSTVNNYTINAGQNLSAFEIARQTRLMSRQMAFARS